MPRVGVVIYEATDNIGDDVQTLAMLELVNRLRPDVAVVLVDRERLDDPAIADLDGLICSGWFMYDVGHWPPAHPRALFVSMHVTTRNKSAATLFHPDLKAYYGRQAGPVGCRDKGTRDRFAAIGVDAYYSACATLTLESRAHRPEPGKGSILAIDPFYHTTFDWGYQNQQLHRLVPPEDHHRIVRMENRFPGWARQDHDARMKAAREYVDAIAAAEVVITSRIHAALPAVAVGTPVFFPLTGYDRNAASMDRFDGILSFFHVLEGNLFPLSSRKRWAKALRSLRVHHLMPQPSLAHWLSAGSSPCPPSDSPEVYREQITAVVSNYLNSL